MSRGILVTSTVGREVLSSVPLGPSRPPVFHKQPEQFRMSGPPTPRITAPHPSWAGQGLRAQLYARWWEGGVGQGPGGTGRSQAPRFPLLPSWGKIRVPDSAPTRPPSPCSLSSSRHPHSPARDPDSLQPSSPPTLQPASSQEEPWTEKLCVCLCVRAGA